MRVSTTTDRKLTYQQAEDVRGLHDEFGMNPHQIARLCDGMFNLSHASIRKTIERVFYASPTPGTSDGDGEPETYDAAAVDSFHQAGRWDVPLPAQPKGVRTTPHTDQPRYAAQNERDGYQRDPAMRAWLFYGADWATEPLDEAAD